MFPAGMSLADKIAMGELRDVKAVKRWHQQSPEGLACHCFQGI
jgi:hypothetical protein